MDISAVLQAFVKGSNNRVNVAASPVGALYATPYGLPYAKWVAEGRGYSVIEATATAGVAALPTTAAGLTLQNGEQDNGKWYVIHSVFATCEASAAAVESAYIAHVIGMNRVAAATNDLGLAAVKPMLAGSGPYAGTAILDLAATVVDDLWKPASLHVSNLVASNSEFSIVQLLDGLVVVKPKAQYSIELCATTTGVTGRLGMVWFEIDAGELSG